MPREKVKGEGLGLSLSLLLLSTIDTESWNTGLSAFPLPSVYEYGCHGHLPLNRVLISIVFHCLLWD